MDVPTGFEDVIQTALAKEPGRRYRHAGELKGCPRSRGETGSDDRISRTDQSRPRILRRLGPLATNPDLGPTMHVARQQLHGETAARPSRPGWGEHDVGRAGTRARGAARRHGGVYRRRWATGAERRSFTATATTVPVSAASQPGPAANRSSCSGSVLHRRHLQLRQRQAKIWRPSHLRRERHRTATTDWPLHQRATAASTSAVNADPLLPTDCSRKEFQSTGSADQRLALVERHIGEYFAALNAGDYARAQAVCCTPAWRARYPLDEWRKNFAGVTDLRFATRFATPPSRPVVSSPRSTTRS